MKKFEKFLKSRNGMLSLFGSLVILLLIVAYFSGALGRITGTAGVSYPLPPNGFTCLPTCAENDSRMFILAGSNQGNMANTPIKVWIMVPGDQPSFTLGIFDGDTGKGIDNTLKLDVKKNFKYSSGHWDDATSGDTTYTLYADPSADGSGQTALASWLGNTVMLNNAWWETSVNNDEQAKAPNGHYYYRLEATRPTDGKGGQAFKVRASGYLMAGLREEWPVGLIARLADLNDFLIVYPNNTGGNTASNMGTPIYNGEWQLHFKISSDVQKIDVWDSDFDRGPGSAPDTDDQNVTGKPNWATTIAIDEGVSSVASSQLDDNSNVMYKISPPVYYEVLSPDEQSVSTNGNPSGSKEWEENVASTSSDDNPDTLVSESFKPGMYSIHIVGMDLQNAFWIGINYPVCDPDGGCPPMPDEQ